MIPSLIDYDRKGNCAVIGSGAGIVMAAMDDIICARYCIDIDSHRQDQVDWQGFGCVIDSMGLDKIFIVGWYTIDRPTIVNQIIDAIKSTHVFRYDGGGELRYDQWIRSIPIFA